VTSAARRPWWKKKRWWALAGLWLVMLYPLGYGPACWIVWTEPHPWIETAIGTVYMPIDLLIMNGPPWVEDPLRWYMELWNPENPDAPFA
jgi:hypothetical protein